MQIIAVKDKQTIKDFINLPWGIYKNDKNWIPHLKQDIEKVFDPQQNKAHANGKIIRWVLKDNNNIIIGRIAAFVDYKIADNFEQPTGGIGFFECINDKEAAFLLFNTAKKWLQSNKMQAMDGSINFGEKNMFWGVLVENFTDPNSYGMNYNPEYYKTFFEEYGFKTYYKQFMYKRDLNVPAQQIFVEKSENIMSNGDYSITNVRGMSIDKLAENFKTVYNAAWGGHDNFKVLSSKNANKIIKALKPVYDKDIIVFVFYKGTPVAFYVNIPELNEIFKYVNGNLNWLGKLKFLYHKLKKTPNTMVGVVFGVDRDFQGKGIEGAMIKWTEENIVTLGRYDQTVLTWIGDFNPKMLKVCDNLGANIYRTYITYRYLFDREKEFKRCPIVG
ncbi:MAG: hypothetical protein JKX68_13615 [Flavobacteriales bacterium]|nr:hypothetical protein [Flavobacteriales bacterium]